MRFRSFYGKGCNKKIYWTIGCSSFGSIVVTNCPKEKDVPGSIRGRDQFSFSFLFFPFLFSFNFVLFVYVWYILYLHIFFSLLASFFLLLGVNQMLCEVLRSTCFQLIIRQDVNIPLFVHTLYAELFFLISRTQRLVDKFPFLPFR